MQLPQRTDSSARVSLHAELLLEHTWQIPRWWALPLARLSYPSKSPDEDSKHQHNQLAQQDASSHARCSRPDEAEGLVVGAGRRRREDKALIRLRRRIADRIGPLHGADPARLPGELCAHLCEHR